MSGTLVSLPQNFLGATLSMGLFIRQEYVDVAHIIQAKLALNKSIKRVLVLGSPGIGKSVFGVLLFLLDIKQKKDVAYHPIDLDFTYFFTWKGTEDRYDVSDSPCTGRKYEGYFDGNERVTDEFTEG